VSEKCVESPSSRSGPARTYLLARIVLKLSQIIVQIRYEKRPLGVNKKCRRLTFDESRPLLILSFALRTGLFAKQEE